MSEQMEQVAEVAEPAVTEVSEVEDDKREFRRRMERERCRLSDRQPDQLALRYAECGFGIDHVQRFSGVDRKVAILLVTG